MRYALLLAIMVQASGATAPSRAAIVVGPVSLGSDNGHTTAEFDLTNSTDEAITAWHINIEAERLNGTATWAGIGKDAYAAYAGLIPDRGDFIRPRATVHIRERLDDLFGAAVPMTVQQFVVSIKCVIFADRTWTGDAAEVRGYFARREQAYLGLTDVINALRKARLSATGVDAMRAALSELNKPDQRDPDNAFKAVMRRNLDNAIKGSGDAAAADEDMRLWLTSLEARWQAAQDHRVQGPPADLK